MAKVPVGRAAALAELLKSGKLQRAAQVAPPVKRKKAKTAVAKEALAKEVDAHVSADTGAAAAVQGVTPCARQPSRWVDSRLLTVALIFWVGFYVKLGLWNASCCAVG